MHPIDQSFIRKRLGDAGQGAHRSQYCNRAAGDQPTDNVFARDAVSEKPLGSSACEKRKCERSNEEDRGRRAEIFGPGNQRVRDLIERCRAAERPKERDEERDGPEDDLLPPRIITKSDERGTSKHQHYYADVVAVQMDAIPAPVVVEHPGKLREICVEDFLGWPRVAGGEAVVGQPAGPRRPLHIFAHRQILHRTHRQADDDGDQRGA